jgi:hypothetical protein
MYTSNDNRLDNLIALPYCKQIQWVAVGHTKLHTKGKDDRQIYGMLLETRKAGSFFTRKFAQFVNGHKALSNSSHPNNPIIISHLHLGQEEKASSMSKTIHYHFAFGNIPECITQQDMMTVFKELWVNKAQQSHKGIWLQQAQTDNEDWFHYGHNENRLGNLLGFDIFASFIPPSE